MKEYIITRQQLEKNIIESGNPICQECGLVITPIETVDNAGNRTHWCGCTNCGIYTSGTTEKVREIAKKIMHRYSYRQFSAKEACDLVSMVLSLNQPHPEG